MYGTDVNTLGMAKYSDTHKQRPQPTDRFVLCSAHTISSSQSHLPLPEQPVQLLLERPVGAAQAAHHLRRPLEVLGHPLLVPAVRRAPLQVPQVVQLVGQLDQLGLVAARGRVLHLQPLPLRLGQRLVVRHLGHDRAHLNGSERRVKWDFAANITL